MDILLITHQLNGVLMMLLGFVLGVLLTRRFDLNWRLWMIGAATFVFSQILHIPFNALLTQLFARGVLPSPPVAWHLSFNAVVLGLSAGLFEELFRYGAFRWLAQDARTWRKAVLMGAGHGGIEAIIVGLLVVVTFFQMASLRNADLAATVPAAQLEATRQAVQAYWSAAWYDPLIAFLERVFALTIQVSMAVIVLQVFIRKQARWLVFAILGHAFADAAGVYAAQTWGPYIGEVVIGMMALAAIGIIFKLYQPEPEEPPAAAPPLAPIPALPADPVEETPENLDKTRFS